MSAPLPVRDHDETPEGWDDLVAGAPHATFFHRSAWAHLYARHHDGRALFLAATDGGVLVGGLVAVEMRRGPFSYLESLPMGTYGGPIVREDRKDRRAVLAALFARFDALASRPRCLWTQCVLRHAEPSLSREGFVASETHILPLEAGFDHFWWHVFPRNRRNECTRAMKRGVRVEITPDIRDMETFYPMHVAAHRRWGRAPHPERFFHEVSEMDAARTLVFSVRHEDRFLGLHLSFVSGDELMAWHGVTTREGANRLFPSAMIVRAEAEEAARRGLSAVNLGGSGGRDGVENFKRLVGGVHAETLVRSRAHPALAMARRLRRLARR